MSTVKVRNKGPWPVAVFDDAAGRVDLPVGEDVDVPARVARALVARGDFARTGTVAEGGE